MVSPSRCPPWQPERPGPTRREPRRAQRSYTTCRDTILFIGAYAVPAADVTAAIRTGRPLTDGWAAAPVPLPPSVGAAMAIRCGSEDACNAMSVNYAAGNTVLAITASVPQGMSQEAMLDLFGRFFSVLGTRVRTH